MAKMLSIITINYNNAAGLEKTIKSVISQTYVNYEYLIIDGKSKDNSQSIIEQYSDKVDYWISEPDRGIYNAMNKGIIQAKGTYILFLNSGDYLASNDSLYKMLEGEDDRCDIIYGDLERTFPDGRKDLVRFPSSIDTGFLLNRTLGHPSTFIKRELFNKYGLYREDLKIASDWAFFVKVIAFNPVVLKRKKHVVSNFCMDGVSSQKANAGMVKKEREGVLHDLFSPELLKAVKKYYCIKNSYKYLPGKIMGGFRKLKMYITR